MYSVMGCSQSILDRHAKKKASGSMSYQQQEKQKEHWEEKQQVRIDTANAAKKQRYESINARKAEFRRGYDEHVAKRPRSLYPGYAEDLAVFMVMRQKENSLFDM